MFLCEISQFVYVVQQFLKVPWVDKTKHVCQEAISMDTEEHLTVFSPPEVTPKAMASPFGQEKGQRGKEAKRKEESLGVES